MLGFSANILSGLAKPILRMPVTGGSLEVIERDYPLFTLGDGHGPNFTIAMNSTDALWKIFANPDLGLGETYVDGKWDLVEGDLGQLLTWLCRNYHNMISQMPVPETHLNTSVASRRNIEHHYDLGNDLYESFLDEGLNYSCGFFDDHRMSLRDAELNKIYTTLLRADIHPGMKVLDIGCGWGELCHTVAQAIPGAPVTGITLSTSQLSYARKKYENDPVRFLLDDYRDHSRRYAGIYDRVVSVGMLEHVGKEFYPEYFRAVESLLKPGGKALIHSITRPDAGSGTSHWLEAYVFPGGSIPYLPDALEAADAQGLTICQPFIHAGHNYAETVRRWRMNFNANFHKLDPERYDRRFKRIWNFYLASCEAAFDGMGFFVSQMMFTKPL